MTALAAPNLRGTFVTDLQLLLPLTKLAAKPQFGGLSFKAPLNPLARVHRDCLNQECGHAVAAAVSPPASLGA